MRLGANAADTIRDERHFFDGTSDDESLKAAQFRDLEIGVGNIAFAIQEDLDLAMTFKTGNGINGYSYVS